MKVHKFEKKPLQLTNDGTLTLFFIGIGSAFTKAYYQTNLLIIKGEDHLMIDCGTKTPQALHELGVNIWDIRNFFITHSHADHIGGLEEVIPNLDNSDWSICGTMAVDNTTRSAGICTSSLIVMSSISTCKCFVSLLESVTLAISANLPRMNLIPDACAA